MDYSYSELNQLLNSLDSGNVSTASLYGTASAAGIWGIIALILAIVGGILVYFLFVKAKSEPKGKFVKWLKEFLSFRVMWIEPIMKVLYYISTIFVVLYSFTYFGMFNLMGGMAFLMFLLTLVLGPILIRIVYEATMMFIMIWHNTKEIADNTKKK